MATVDEILGPPKRREAWVNPQATIVRAAGPSRFTSGKRSPADNARVGGSRTSAHLTGEAQDFVPADGNTAAAARKLAASGVPYDQIIDEGDHVHVSYGPKMRGQVLGKGRPAPIPSVDDFLGAPPKPKVDDLLGPAPAVKPAAAKVSATAKAKPTPAKAPSLMDNIVADYRSRTKRATDMMAGAIEGMTTPEGEAAADPLGNIKGALSLAAGAGAYAAAPLTAAVQNVVGRPAEILTGGKVKKETVADAVETAGGFLVGGPKKVKPTAAADTTYAPFKATKAEKALAMGEAVPKAEKALAKGEAVPKVDDVLGPVAAAAGRGAALTVDDILGPAVATPATKPAKVKEMAAATEDPLDDILFKPGAGPTRLKPGAYPAEPVPKGVTDHALDAAGAVQKILAPATVGLGREAAMTLRRASSEADLSAAQSAHTLLEHTRKVEALPVEQQRALVDYIEGRSLGAKLDDPSLQKTADDIRKVNETYRSKIEDLIGDEADGMGFIQDYYSHMWKEAPNLVATRMNARQGSGRNLKARSIPTMAEGIEAGLTPKFENPLEATINYANNMSRYLATVDAQAELTANGYAKFATQGAQPEGWVPLNGIRTTKQGRTIVQDGEVVANQLPQQMYAPADVARVYNNWISKGLESGDIGPLFEGARKAANGMVMLKLGFSAFHAMTMVQESMVSEMARGVQAMSRAPGLAAKGELGAAGRTLAKGAGAFGANAIPGVGLYRSMNRGNTMRKELLTGVSDNATSKAVNDAFVRAGGRVRMDELYRTRGAGSFYNAVHRGTWKRELKETANRIFGANPRMLDRAAGVIDAGANAIQTFSAPLFEEMIPRLKQGAFASTMEDWLAANPNATQKAIDVAASDINRSIDNRFGEMAWDNLFWNQHLKQSSRLLLLSPTWNMGTINELGGGLVDALGPSFKGLIDGAGVTPRTAYIAAGIAQVALVNGILTYLKTGEAPTGMDYAVYRTGGVDAASGEPERALTPGYQKDVYAFAYDFPNHIGQEVKNKLNPALKLALELSSNKDFRGLPISPGEGAVKAEGDKDLGDYLIEAFMPISFSAFAKGQKEGSNITPLEQNLAIRAAPAYLTAPERQKRFKEMKNRKEWKRKQRADQRALNMRQNKD